MSRFAREPDSALIASDADQARNDLDGTNRRSFLRSSGGYATGVVAMAIPVAAVVVADADAASTKARTIRNPTTPAPSQPVMAYVHDAKRGTVVIMRGTTEHTVHDPELVRRLLHAPKKTPAHKRKPSAKTTPKKRP